MKLLIFAVLCSAVSGIDIKTSANLRRNTAVVEVSWEGTKETCEKYCEDPTGPPSGGKQNCQFKGGAFPKNGLGKSGPSFCKKGCASEASESGACKVWEPEESTEVTDTEEAAPKEKTQADDEFDSEGLSKAKSMSTVGDVQSECDRAYANKDSGCTCGTTCVKNARAGHESTCIGKDMSNMAIKDFCEAKCDPQAPPAKKCKDKLASATEPEVTDTETALLSNPPYPKDVIAGGRRNHDDDSPAETHVANPRKAIPGSVMKTAALKTCSTECIYTNNDWTHCKYKDQTVNMKKQKPWNNNKCKTDCNIPTEGGTCTSKSN